MIDLKDYVPFLHGQCIINSKYIIRIEYYIDDELHSSVQIIMTDKTLMFNFDNKKAAEEFLNYIKSFV